MQDRDFYDAASEALARKGRKAPRRRKMTTVVLPDDPRIKRSRKPVLPLADRQPIRGDRIGECEDAIWMNVGRVIEDVDRRAAR